MYQYFATTEECSNKLTPVLTHALMETSISESIDFANNAAPSDPNNGASRVLLAPAMGHLANTTMEPPTPSVIANFYGLRCLSDEILKLCILSLH